jgi:hypothetical protein
VAELLQPGLQARHSSSRSSSSSGSRCRHT